MKVNDNVSVPTIPVDHTMPVWRLVRHSADAAIWWDVPPEAYTTRRQIRGQVRGPIEAYMRVGVYEIEL
jgi:hypothetical protein